MIRSNQTPNSQRLGYVLIGIAILLTISLIGGDGAGSVVRKAMALQVPGFTVETRARIRTTAR